MDKFYELGLKTGLKPADMKRSARFGLLGMLALALASLAACLKNGKTDARPPDPRPQSSTVPAAEETVKQTQTLQDLVGTLGKSTAPAQGQPGAQDGKHCGPYPGYPCGTRYFTVSAADFRRA